MGRDVKLYRDLRRIPLEEVLPLGRRGQRVITMAEDQWDTLLSVAYRHGWVLLEVDELERPVRAFQSLPERGRKFGE